MAKKSEKEKKKFDINSLIVKATDYVHLEDEIKSSGIIPLDLALRVGGYRSGRLVEIYGPEHSGKTLMAMLCAIQEMNVNKKALCLFIDTEGSFDGKWWETLGGDSERLHIYDPYSLQKNKKMQIYGEDVYDNIIDLIDTGKYSVAILDSYVGPALMTNKLLDRKLDDTKRMGVQAMLNGDFVKRLFLKITRTDTTFIITNHLMEKLGVMFGNPETTPGGKALKFYAEQRIVVRSPKKKEEGVGHNVNGAIVKNKRAATAGQKFEFWLSYNHGVNNNEEIVTYLVKYKLISSKEKDKVLESLRTDKTLYTKYRQDLLDYIQKNRDEVDDEEIDDMFKEEVEEELEVFE